MPTVDSRETLRTDLAALLPAGRASTNPADLLAYGRDLWPRNQIGTRTGQPMPTPPAVVVWPGSLDEVVNLVRYAAERGVELVPFGAGSGVCAGIAPGRDAVLVDVKRMHALRSIDGNHLVAEAEAGIVGQPLEEALAARGFTMGHFPSSIYCSTLGGWIAARSAGQCSGRYGKIEDMVLGLTFVDGRGEVHRPERNGRDAALLPLFIGSEGTLGIVTDARVRIAPAAKHRRFASFTFASVDAGLAAIRKIYQAGLRPAVARLYDPFDTMMAKRGRTHSHGEEDAIVPTSASARPTTSRGMRALVNALRLPGTLNRIIDHVPEAAFGGAMMVLMWESDPTIADAELQEAIAIAARGGGKSTGEGPARRWLAHRHSVSYRQSPLLAAGGFVDTMEVAACWSRMMPMYRAVRAALAPHVLVMAHFSHAYPDGASIYFTFAGAASSDAKALEAYDRAWAAALTAVVDVGGTLSHHHGVGRSKASAVPREIGAGVEIIRQLKRQLDPRGIMNPGAVIPLSVLAANDGPDAN